MGLSADQFWQACLEEIREHVDRRSFKTWFEPLKPLKVEDLNSQIRLTVLVPSRFYYDWLEEHYAALMRKTASKILGTQGRIVYEIRAEQDPLEEEQQSQRTVAARPKPTPPPVQTSFSPETMRPQPTPQPPSPEPTRSNPSNIYPLFPAEPNRPIPHGLQQQLDLQQPPAAKPPTPSISQPAAQLPIAPVTPPPVANPFIIPGIRKVQVESQLNANYTFDRFIEGDCNRLARSAAWAIAERPGETSFNPFLVYGGVGLGKTHLIQAIGNYARQHQKIESILYISSERFTQEFVQSIQHNRISEFSLFYRQIDLLIVDDIQFFGGKEKTQEEFFHIFNALHQSGRQIILSADRPPKDIDGIEERLLSRFQWGLTADVQPPDLETRIAILHRKADDDGIQISNDIIEFVAHNITSNIRELEGALIRLLAHSTLRRQEIDLSFAKEVLKDLIKEVKVSLSIEEIQRIVCNYFQVPEDLVRAKTRKQEVVQARQVAMYFAKLFTKHSLKTIGLHFGGRDHSTVIHAIQSIEDYVETDTKFQEMIREIQHKIEIHSR